MPVSRSVFRPTQLLPERLGAVLAVVYLIFNEGYSGRVDLAAEALRLGAALAELMPDEPEVHGLRALMLLNDARREARFEDGELVLLADQDRSRWNDAQIARGREALVRALALQGGQARTSSRRRSRRSHMDEPLDWPQIAALYGELVRLTGSAVVELNRAIAVAEAEGAEAGLALVDRLDLDGYQYFHSTRADLLRRLGRADEARTEYRRRARARAHRARAPLPAAARRRSQRIAVPSPSLRSSSRRHGTKRRNTWEGGAWHRAAAARAVARSSPSPCSTEGESYSPPASSTTPN